MTALCESKCIACVFRSCRVPHNSAAWGLLDRDRSPNRPQTQIQRTCPYGPAPQPPSGVVLCEQSIHKETHMARTTTTRVRKHTTAALLAVAFLTAAPTTVWAQPTDGSDTKQPAARTGLINLDFPGGTSGEFLALVSRSFDPQPFNYLVRNGAQNILLPPVRLRSVDVQTALEAVLQGEFSAENVIDAPKGLTASSVKVIAHSGYAGLNAGLGARNGGPQGAPIFEINRRDNIKPTVFENKDGSRSGPKGQPSIQALSIRDVTTPPSQYAKFDGAAMKVEDVVQSIQSAMLLSAKAWKISTGEELPEPTLLYHQESGMLLMQATQDQIYIAEKVLNEITRDLAVHNHRFDEIIERENDLEVSKSRYKSLRLSLDRTYNMLEEAKAVHAQALREFEADQDNPFAGDAVETAEDDIKELQSIAKSIKLELVDMEAAISIDENALEASRRALQSSTSSNETHIMGAANLKRFETQIARVIHAATDNRASVRWNNDDSSFVINASEKDFAVVTELFSLLLQVQANDPGLRPNVVGQPANNRGR